MKVGSMQKKCLDTDTAESGESVCLNIKSIDKTFKELNRRMFRKGMMIFDLSVKPVPCSEFTVKAKILNCPNLFQEGYQTVIHCGVIRQSAKMIKIDK